MIIRICVNLEGLLVYDDVEFMLNSNLDLVTHRKEESQLLP